jgi:hypothetical protein
MKPATNDVTPHAREAERGGVLSKRGVFLAGTAGGALIWLASPLMTGYREPWDAPGPYYTLSLGCLGIVLGALAPRLFWLAGLAGLFGEFLVFASRALVPPQELWVLGMVALIVYAGVILLGAVVGALGSVLARWVRHRLGR